MYYTNTIAPKIFKYKKALQDFKVEEYLGNLIKCDCSHSPLDCYPFGHVIMGDLNIIKRDNLQKIVSHGHKIQEPQF